ncbi:MAG: CYTH domain-containing protein [Acidobacteria bacterium]|nr:CYTH domain-containing protein [Acidobacteriota bacterium]
MIETEIKLIIRDQQHLSEIKEFCKSSSTAVFRFEDDKLFDFEDNRLSEKSSIFRLRAAYQFSPDNNEIDLESVNYRFTWKSPADGDPGFKVMNEIELLVQGKQPVSEFIKSFQLSEIFHYQKFREIYHLEKTEILIDRTPMGFIVEIEGEQGEIDKLAEQFGFTRADYINKDYYCLWQDYREELGIQSKDMIFPELEGKLA